LIWHDISCRDRILKWREWRNSLALLTLDECLKEVAVAWAKAPLVNHYLTPDDINEWPDPWQLINDNIYCDLSIALGMFYSITLCDNPHISDNVRIEIYKSVDGWINLCSIDQGLYMLNWEPRSVVNISTLPNLGNSIFVYSKIDLVNKLN
jgi:hypothetical protein